VPTQASRWMSARSPAYCDVVDADLTPSDAIGELLEFGSLHNLQPVRVYVSTAITSAGFRRDPDLAGVAHLAEVVRLNGETCGLVLEELTRGSELVTAENTMVPTELGHVAGWTDFSYLQFYFCWMAGLGRDGARRVERDVDRDDVKKALTVANDRHLFNDARWPAYQFVTDELLTGIDSVLAAEGMRDNSGCSVLLQVLDVDQSLGCRAEARFAERYGLDVIAPRVDVEQGDLADLVHRLRELGARVGTPLQAVDAVALELRRG
jgi:hypothetical protein